MEVEAERFISSSPLFVPFLPPPILRLSFLSLGWLHPPPSFRGGLHQQQSYFPDEADFNCSADTSSTDTSEDESASFVSDSFWWYPYLGPFRFKLVTNAIDL